LPELRRRAMALWRLQGSCRGRQAGNPFRWDLGGALSYAFTDAEEVAMRAVLGKGVGVEFTTWFWTTASPARWRRQAGGTIWNCAGEWHITLGVKQSTTRFHG
jgi:hypothetical protein